MTQERILIVEGDISLSEVLKDRLEAKGYLVECARNGTEALGILKARWIDLIVLAVVLHGGMNGYRFFKEVKRRKGYSKIPVVLQSSKAAMRETFEALGVEAYFAKPYDIDQFIDEIQDILAKKVLVISRDAALRAALKRELGDYDFHADIVESLQKFYASVTANRYSLVIMPHKIGKSAADRLISAVRESQKNKRIPAIVYLSREALTKDAKGARDVRVIKLRCEKFNKCRFVELARAEKILELSRRFLEIA
ncbi:MAG: response regulator [Candidatus Omnitrophota bacterium]